MFLKMCILIVSSLIFGGATAAGVIALLTKLGVVPRMIGRFQLAGGVLSCENAVVLGTMTGCVLSLSSGQNSFVLAGGLYFLLQFLVLLAALGTGIYVGCQAMALAEILNVFPILFRRAKLQLGLQYLVLAVALGKLAGSLCYFIFCYQSK